MSIVADIRCNEDVLCVYYTIKVKVKKSILNVRGGPLVT